MTRQETTRVVRKVSAAFVVAVVLAVVLAGTALAAAIGVPQNLQEWFSQEWTLYNKSEMPETQSTIIDSLIQPVGVTCINKGVTVTLDSVTPGEGGLWMLYKVKGEILEDEAVKRLRFSNTSLGGKLMETGTEGKTDIPSGLLDDVGVTEDGTHIYMELYQTFLPVDFYKGGELELRLENLTLLGEDQIDPPAPPPRLKVIEATWVLPFTLAPTEKEEPLTAEKASVPSYNYDVDIYKGKEPTMVEITDIRVTSTGISFIEPAWESFETRDYATMDIKLQMKNGEKVPCQNGGILGAMEMGEPCKYSWTIPVDLSQAESLYFGTPSFHVIVPLTQNEP